MQVRNEFASGGSMRAFLPCRAWRRAALFASFLPSIAAATLPLTGAQQVSAGVAQTCALVNGGVQCWGNYAAVAFEDISSQLYYYDYTSTLPAPIPGLATGVTKIAVSGYQVCALASGVLRCYPVAIGGTPSSGLFPPPVSGLASGVVTDISVGGNNACAIINGAAQCWGDNYSGQLGNSTLGVGGSSSVPIDVNGLPAPVTKIVNGGTFAYNLAHTCAIAAGSIWCWGDNEYDQLAADTSPAYETATPQEVGGVPGGAVTDITVGTVHTCAVVGGAAYCWGANFSGQLGSSVVPIGAATYYPHVVDGLSAGVTAIAAGGDNTCAVVNHSVVKCWGDGSYGQLGSGPAADSGTPVTVALGLAGVDQVTSIAVGGEHVCVTVHGSGGIDSLRCWGNNEDGQTADIGSGNITTPTPTPVAGLSATSISTGGTAQHACAVVNAGAQCWGANNYAQLGNGSRTDNSSAYYVTNLGAAHGVTQLATAGSFTCAVVNHGAQCWGSQSWGELGNGSQQTNSPTPAAVSGLGSNSGVMRIAVARIAPPLFAGFGLAPSGNAHACAVVSGGVKCWGANGWGQLGSSSVPSGSDPNYPYDQYFSASPAAVYPASSGVTDIAVGNRISCAVVNATAQCWGALTGNANYPNGNPTPVAVQVTGTTVTKIAAGFNHVCAVVDGGVQCWGDNSLEELGHSMGEYSNSLTPIEVINLPPGSGVTDIAAGDAFTCVVASGGVQCWGSDLNGVDILGISSNPIYRCYSTPDGTYCGYWGANTVTGLESGSGVVAIGSGADYACALLNDGSEKCWGGNFNGQLGDGRTLISLPQTVEEGDKIFISGFDG